MGLTRMAQLQADIEVIRSAWAKVPPAPKIASPKVKRRLAMIFKMDLKTQPAFHADPSRPDVNWGLA
jgi:hypothetical protein